MSSDYQNPYETVSVIDTIETELRHKKIVSILEMQAKKRDDGSKTRAYPILRFNLGGRRNFFLHIDVAEVLVDQLASLIPEAKEIQDKITKEIEEARAKYDRSKGSRPVKETEEFTNRPKLTRKENRNVKE